MNEKEKQRRNNKTNKKRTPKTIIKKMWIGFACFIGVLTITFALISIGAIGYMPDVEELENPIDKYAYQIYSTDGHLLGTYSLAKNNRIYSNYEDMPRVMNGLGIAIVSTSKGIMTDKKARREKVGGEILAFVW